MSTDGKPRFRDFNDVPITVGCTVRSRNATIQHHGTVERLIEPDPRMPFPFFAVIVNWGGITATERTDDLIVVQR